MRRLAVVLGGVVVLLFAFTLERSGAVKCIGLLATVLSLLFVLAYRRSLVAPSNLFIFTFWLFLVSRHFLADIGAAPSPIIGSAGFNEVDLFVSRVVLCITIIVLMVAYAVAAAPALAIYKMMSRHADAFRCRVCRWRVLIAVPFLIAGPILVHSVLGMTRLIRESGYVSALQDDTVAHFDDRAYTVFKWSWILLFAAYTKRPKLSWLITLYFLVCLGSTLASGLRGYFLIYALFVVMLLDGTRVLKVRFLHAAIGGAGVLALATVLLEYRLGFVVSDATVLSKLSAGVWSQGVTTEVFYGAVEQRLHLDFVKNVLLQGHFGNLAFGDVLDGYRGIYYDGKGGLASSGFAEAYSGGWPVYLITLVLLGGTLRFMDLCFSEIRRNALGLVVLFFFFPAIIYFPRGSLNPLIYKTAFVLAAVLICSILHLQKRENTSDT